MPLKYLVRLVFAMILPVVTIRSEAMPISCWKWLLKSRGDDTVSQVLPTFGEIEKGVNYLDRPGAYALLVNAQGEIAVIETTNGYFLPGGGVESDETSLQALRREIQEETGLELNSQELMGRAIQFRWSPFYKQHFRKIGDFYKITVRTMNSAQLEPGHRLVWLTKQRALELLTEEYQRWAVNQL